MKSSLVFSLATVVLASWSCNNTEKSNQYYNWHPSRITIDGSSTLFPVSEAVAKQFVEAHPSIKISINVSGTGGGFKKFARGETDINDASRSINEDEDGLCQANNIQYIAVKICYDGISIVVNPGNTWAGEITVAELKKIWAPEAFGKITKWNQIRASWPDEEFHLYGPDAESGTYDYFTQTIIGKGRSRLDYVSSGEDNILVQGVFSDINALGFFGYSCFFKNDKKLKLLAVDDLNDANGKGPVLPDIATVRDKTYGPLSRPLLIYINGSAMKRNEIKDFVNYYLDNAAKFSIETGTIPMTENEYAFEKMKFKKFFEVIN